MDIIPSLLRDYGWAIYIAAALGFVYFVIVGLTSMRDLNKAVFGLERSSVSARASSAWVRAAMCIVVGIAVYIASNMVGAAPTRVRITSIINATSTVPAAVVLVPTSGPTADFLAPAITPTFVIQSAQPQAAAAEATDILETPGVGTPGAGTPGAGTPSANASNLIDIGAVTPAKTPAVVETSTSVPGLPTAAQIPTDASTSAAASRTTAGTAAGTASPTSRIATAVASPTVATPQPSPLPTLPPTGTPIPETPTPARPEMPAADCADPYTVGISAPQNGQTVSGQVAVIGNAGIDPAGGYAKLEVLLSTGWGFISKIDNPIKDGQLGSLNTAALGQGVHRIRLTRVDKNQREDLLCAISIFVAN